MAESDQSREARLSRIIDMMHAGEFVRGKTAKALADEWQTSLSVVQQLTAEASRRVRAGHDPAEAALFIQNRLEAVERAAEEDGAHAARVSALNLYAEITGAKAPKRVEAVVETLTPEQAKERLRELVPALGEALK